MVRANMVDRVREIVAEAKFSSWVASVGGEAIKLDRSQFPNYPDRLVLTHVNRYFWIEFKRIGEEPRKGQLLLHKHLRKKGQIIYVCQTFKEAKEAYESEVQSS